MRRIRKLIICRLILLACAAGAWPVLAQTGTTDTDRDSTALRNRARTLDTIQVQAPRSRPTTATRMPLTIKQTPQSVSVITRQQLDNFGMDGLDTALDHATGITVGKYDSQRAVFSARGFGISNFQIDGVPQGVNAPLSDTAFYERIEIVRGATGLLGGTGDPSATVNMIRKRPMRDYAVAGKIQLGRWDLRRFQADVSVPLTADGGVRSRVVGALQDSASFMRGYGQNITLGMAVLEADLGERTVLRFSGDIQNTDPTGATWGALPYWNQDGSLARLPRDFNLSTRWSTWRNRQQTWTGTLEHQFENDWQARLSLSRIASANTGLVAFGGGGHPNPATGRGMRLWISGWVSEAVNRNVDLFVTGPFNLLGRQHTLLAGWNGWFEINNSPGGGLYWDSDRDRPYDVEALADIPDYRSWTGDHPKPIFLRNGAYTKGSTQLGGGYLATRLSLADPVNVIVGARVSNYRTWTRNYDNNGRYTYTDDRNSVSREVTPYLGATWDLTPTYSAYASYTDLFKPQSFRDRNNRYLAPVTGSNVEGGVKATWHDGKINGALTVFRTTQKNIAELDPTVPPDFRLPGAGGQEGPQAYVANKDGVIARGLELEANGWLTPRWHLVGGYTWLQAEEQDGRRAVPNQPVHTLRLSSTYRFSHLPGLKLGAALRAQSGIYVKWGRPLEIPVTDNRISQGGYALFDLMASYEFNDQLRLQLNLDNAFDRYYYRNVGFYNGVFWGEPRNWILSLRWDL